jgi:hypothetical protein
VPVATSDVIKWLTFLGWDTNQETGCPLVMGPYIPDEPDQIAILTPTTGPGFMRDGATDMCGFQARVRGGQSGDGSTDAQAATETLAYTLDALIFAAPYPFVLASGRVLVTAHRLSGIPAPMAQTSDDMDRSTYTCSYLIEVSN